MKEIVNLWVILKNVSVSNIPRLKNGRDASVFLRASIPGFKGVTTKVETPLATETRNAEWHMIEKLRFKTCFHEIMFSNVEMQLEIIAAGGSQMATVSLPLRNHARFNDGEVVKFQRRMYLAQKYAAVGQQREGGAYHEAGSSASSLLPVEIKGTFFYKNFPSSAQMVCGVHTDTGIEDALPAHLQCIRPLIRVSKRNLARRNSMPDNITNKRGSDDVGGSPMTAKATVAALAPPCTAINTTSTTILATPSANDLQGQMKDYYYDDDDDNKEGEEKNEEESVMIKMLQPRAIVDDDDRKIQRRRGNIIINDDKASYSSSKEAKERKIEGVMKKKKKKEKLGTNYKNNGKHDDAAGAAAARNGSRSFLSSSPPRRHRSRSFTGIMRRRRKTKKDDDYDNTQKFKHYREHGRIYDNNSLSVNAGSFEEQIEDGENKETIIVSPRRSKKNNIIIHRKEVVPSDINPEGCNDDVEKINRKNMAKKMKERKNNDGKERRRDRNGSSEKEKEQLVPSLLSPKQQQQQQPINTTRPRKDSGQSSCRSLSESSSVFTIPEGPPPIHQFRRARSSSAYKSDESVKYFYNAKLGRFEPQHRSRRNRTRNLNSNAPQYQQQQQRRAFTPLPPAMKKKRGNADELIVIREARAFTGPRFRSRSVSSYHTTTTTTTTSSPLDYDDDDDHKEQEEEGGDSIVAFPLKMIPWYFKHISEEARTLTLMLRISPPWSVHREKKTRKIYYVNHETRTTQWSSPVPLRRRSLVLLEKEKNAQRGEEGGGSIGRKLTSHCGKKQQQQHSQNKLKENINAYHQQQEQEKQKEHRRLSSVDNTSLPAGHHHRRRHHYHHHNHHRRRSSLLIPSPRAILSSSSCSSSPTSNQRRNHASCFNVSTSTSPVSYHPPPHHPLDSPSFKTTPPQPSSTRKKRTTPVKLFIAESPPSPPPPTKSHQHQQQQHDQQAHQRTLKTTTTTTTTPFEIPAGATISTTSSVSPTSTSSSSSSLAPLALEEGGEEEEEKKDMMMLAIAGEEEEEVKRFATARRSPETSAMPPPVAAVAVEAIMMKKVTVHSVPFGMTARRLLVINVWGEAAQQGVSVGDRILKINNQSLSSHRDMEKIFVESVPPFSILLLGATEKSILKAKKLMANLRLKQMQNGNLISVRPKRQFSVPVNKGKLNKIVNLGFDEELSHEALYVSRGKTQKALKWLFGKPQRLCICEWDIRYDTRSKKVYYANNTSKQTQWHRPIVPESMQRIYNKMVRDTEDVDARLLSEALIHYKADVTKAMRWLRLKSPKPLPLNFIMQVLRGELIYIDKTTRKRYTKRPVDPMFC